MRGLSCALILLLALTGGSAIIVRSLEELAEAKKTAQTITLLNLWVPPGVTLDLSNLLPGTSIEFDGVTKFGYALWEGPLILLSGINVHVYGMPNHLIDCEGQRWWDGLGGSAGKKKPWFFRVRVSDSKIEYLNIKNIPVNGFSVIGKNLVIDHIKIDSKEGHKTGRNTDAFDVSHSSFVTISNCVVDNQDDCLALNSGSDITFINNVCNGGHGISIAPKGNGTVVSNVYVGNCVIADSMTGVRIKTPINQHGLVSNITYENITLKNIDLYGIVVHGNYGVPDTEQPSWGYPVNDLKMINVKGNARGRRSTGVWIWIKEGSNWTWTNTNVSGGRTRRHCQGIPQGLNIPCGK